MHLLSKWVWQRTSHDNDGVLAYPNLMKSDWVWTGGSLNSALTLRGGHIILVLNSVFVGDLTVAQSGSNNMSSDSCRAVRTSTKYEVINTIYALTLYVQWQQRWSPISSTPFSSLGWRDPRCRLILIGVAAHTTSIGILIVHNHHTQSQKIGWRHKIYEVTIDIPSHGKWLSWALIWWRWWNASCNPSRRL